MSASSGQERQLDPEQEQARGVLLQHGLHACDLQTLESGYRHWRSASGNVVVNYVQQRSVRLVAGGPVGEPNERALAASAFVADARASSQRVLWFLTEEQGRLDLASVVAADSWLQVGAQPVWLPERLQREFQEHRSLRQQLHRAANKDVQISEWPIERARESVALMRCLVHWLQTRRAPPLRFLAGPLLLPDLRDRRIFVAERHGEPVGYLLLLPVPARRGVLVEQIVRGHGACNGTSESLVGSAVDAACADALQMITFGCSPLSVRGQSEPLAQSRWLRVARRFGRYCYDFDGVEQWKAKFQPEGWEPLWFGSVDGRLRAQDWLALARAQAGPSLLRFGLGVLRRSVRRQPPGSAAD